MKRVILLKEMKVLYGISSKIGEEAVLKLER